MDRTLYPVKELLKKGNLVMSTRGSFAGVLLGQNHVGILSAQAFCREVD